MLGKQLIQAAAGAAGAGGGALYVDDVFSTFLFEGSVSPVTITNGLDLSGEGGLIWIKSRTSTASHATSSSANNYYGLMTPNTDAADADSTTQYVRGTSTGFEVLYGNITPNDAGEDMASWSFRKAPGFFTCVQYTGTGVNRTVDHDLASIPGMMIVKCTNTAGTNWLVYHRSLGATKAGILDLTNAPVTSVGPWNNTAPTSTQFTVGVSNDVNKDGDTYVAYIFAHDDQSFGTDSDESIIKCDSYTGNGSATGPTINLGFEPQWILVRGTSATNWSIADNMRGIASSGNDLVLKPNATDADQSYNFMSLESTGFSIKGAFGDFNNSGQTYIYMAIRRPNKPPTAATEVFGVATQVPPVGNQGAHRSGFVADMAIRRRLLVTTYNYTSSRLLSGTQLSTNTNDAESAEVDNKYDYMNGYFAESDTSTDKIAWLFKRAPGFFDVVAFTAPGTNTQTINHNLGAVPEFFVVKKTSFTGSWQCYHKDLGNTKYLNLDTDAKEEVSSARWNNTTPTATQFTLGSQFQSTRSYVVYFFATLPDISKVGSYTGTGNAINVDCGFSAGARFILIKRTDASGDWFVYDTTRGIVSGNDPYILLNTTGTQVTGTDYIDPLSSGFTVTSSAPTGLNASGGTYIFLAIA